MEAIYLDYNATTPIAMEVADAMQPYLYEHFGNPSSSHAFGMKAKEAVEKARGQVSQLINCDPSELVFTSGGTESNNSALRGAALAYSDRGKHIITSSIEHPAVTEVCLYLEKKGFELSILPVDKYGVVDPAEVEAAIRLDTILVSVMHANNEVGSIQPIEEISKITRPHGILLHTDAAQSLGKIPVQVDELGVDLLSLAGHKLYAPKGIGALYIRRGVKLEKLMHGADHEQNRRAGTENVPEIVGLGTAAELSAQHLEEHALNYLETRDLLQSLLMGALPLAEVNGHPERRLPNTLSIGFPEVDAGALLAKLEGIAASAGAACHADRVKVSSVLEAMKVPREYARGTLRLSTGRDTTTKQITRAAGVIIKELSKQ